MSVTTSPEMMYEQSINPFTLRAAANCSNEDGYLRSSCELHSQSAHRNYGRHTRIGFGVPVAPILDQQGASDRRNSPTARN
ncbi:hypothetical protein NDU88_006962 [Pleurodeles waltl]|uniref:Uncharacterized protein n=1 Tax=Pleurodeles waltl TaxID=8319 RepID=A0AAV7TYI2_PLEWA|nr:hypothetical protein NDU88_006962 [Pleurodeles waltl]